MNFFAALKDVAGKTLRFISGRTAFLTRSLHRAASPQADRLLSDAVRLAELPSPTEREERRAAFVTERLTALEIPTTIDEDGNVFARIPAENPADPRPLLLFADLGTTRWNPLRSLSRVDAGIATGAGLIDSLGAATLLGLAESRGDGSLKCDRDLLFLFAARSQDDPRSQVFARIAEEPKVRPIAAIGVRGSSLGTISIRPFGTYRIQVRVRTTCPVSTALGGQSATEGPSAVDAAVAVARRLGGVRWDKEGDTACRIRRIEAGIGFGRIPTDGIVDIEIESANPAVLELAMKAAVATAETAGRDFGAQTEVAIVGHVPVGDASVSAPLVTTAKDLMKELKIKTHEQSGADPGAFMSGCGIPALSIGVALGRESLDCDEIAIDSIASGLRLVAALAQRIAGMPAP